MIEDKGYYDFGDFLRKYFPCKVQKISINAGFTCPNRDGNKGQGGCTYCNNQTFNPDYCKPALSISQQLEEGKTFFARKYPEMKYLAYFQAYTNTYAPIEDVIAMYQEALAVEDVVGLIIGTRPDCMPEALLNYFSSLANDKFVLIEYGVESSKNETLELINRGHSWEDTKDAIIRTHNAGILCGAHIILGLPEENEADMLNTIKDLSALPIDTLKIHQLQLIVGTRLAKQVLNKELNIMRWEAKDYIQFCANLIPYVAPTIAIERFVSQSPEKLLISPRWGLKNYEFTNLLNNYIKSHDIHQGSKHQGSK